MYLMHGKLQKKPLQNDRNSKTHIIKNKLKKRKERIKHTKTSGNKKQQQQSFFKKNGYILREGQILKNSKCFLWDKRSCITKIL